MFEGTPGIDAKHTTCEFTGDILRFVILHSVSRTKFLSISYRSSGRNKVLKCTWVFVQWACHENVKLLDVLKDLDTISIKTDNV